VLDTWASSWLWPISVFDGFDKPEGEVSYYYPTNVLVTGWDIIFFWVARMIMAGYEYKGQKPFQAVYFTGMVRDNTTAQNVQIARQLPRCAETD
jgi:valyl-tRNA synthetase